jgi:hypothetical protein
MCSLVDTYVCLVVRGEYTGLRFVDPPFFNLHFIHGDGSRAALPLAASVITPMLLE